MNQFPGLGAEVGHPEGPGGLTEMGTATGAGPVQLCIQSLLSLFSSNVEKNQTGTHTSKTDASSYHEWILLSEFPSTSTKFPLIY
jgi:hypothetical protein